MSEDDFDAFSTTLDGVCGLLSRGAYAPSSTNTALFFRALVRHDIATVRAGFDAHVRDPQRGRFVPTPADILAQIEGKSDGRPEADEAWAMVPVDEGKTAVWTNEMAMAFGVAFDLIERRDLIGARMAFKAAYTRIVDEARAEGKECRWTVTLGDDPNDRERALKAAIETGKITRERAIEYAPSLALPAPVLARIEGKPAAESMVKPEFKSLIQAMKERMALARENAPEPIKTIRSDVGRSTWIDVIQNDQLPPGMRR